MMTENRPLLKIKPINLGLHFGYFAVLTGLAAAGLISANILLTAGQGAEKTGKHINSSCMPQPSESSVPCQPRS